jgi:UDP-N-acetylglucosamine 2-epimerase
MIRVLCIFGTRPEAIKMAPVIRKLRAQHGVECIVCVTGQHRQMLDQVLDFFGIAPDYDLNLMRDSQNLSELTGAILSGVTTVLRDRPPHRVIVHGDTTTTLAASLASFYERIPVGHVEAGLRTGDLQAPWPEELNRRFTDIVSDMCWAPTKFAAAKLLAEGVQPSNVFVTGNTVVDALNQGLERLNGNELLMSQVRSAFDFIDAEKRLILVTGHRRESFGEKLTQICLALQELSKRDDVQIIYPVHMNPLVRETVNAVLGSTRNIFLLPPQSYHSFIYLMQQSHFIITDSGGIQEEAPAIRKPVLVTRDKTERPEGLDGGTSRLVGAHSVAIVHEATKLLDDESAYQAMSSLAYPFGDGKAAQRIVESIVHRHASA